MQLNCVDSLQEAITALSNDVIERRKKMHGESNIWKVLLSLLMDISNVGNTYFVILDSFINTLKHRFNDYSNIVKKFEILNPKKNFKENIEENIVSNKQLFRFYEVDID